MCIRDRHYTYTPLPGQEEEPQAEKRPPFLRRVVKYFEGSTTDRTFEKKIDFTFAGGPSYSKNTSLGIGLLAAGLYRIDRTDSVTAPSDISIFANVSDVYKRQEYISSSANPLQPLCRTWLMMKVQQSSMFFFGLAYRGAKSSSSRARASR